MSAKHKGRTARDRSSVSHSLHVLALLSVAVFINLAIPQDAVSQISSRTVSTPFSKSTPHVTQPKLPKAPEQVAMPAPAPTKVVPGMEEALVATGRVSDEESKALDAAIQQFHDAPLKRAPGSDYSDYAKPLLAFIAAHPNSNWNAALKLNIGLGYYHAGYFSKAFTYLQDSWQLGRNAQGPQIHLLIDRAVGELAKMHARVGHEKELGALFKDIGTRPVGGPGAQLLQGAREGYFNFRHHIQIAFLCGPLALKNMLVALKASPKQIKVADDATSGPHGYTLSQLAALADKAGLKYTLIHREPGQPIPVPSIINWNIHHYAAIASESNGTYILRDPTFGLGGAVTASAKAIDEEGSGYFLVPKSVAAKYPNPGWRTVAAASAEAKAAYGMGSTAHGMTNQTGCPYTGTNNQSKSTGQTSSQQIPSGQSTGHSTSLKGPQMTEACATFMTVNLNLHDTPVGYQPQVGSTPQFTTVFYNSGEAVQPATFGFSNLSPNWTHNRMTYIIDNPTVPPDWIMRVPGGGGGIDYVSGGYNDNPYFGYNLEPPNGSQVLRYPLNGSVPASYYLRNLNDGSQEKYGLSNGATTYPRLLFLTSITDPQGNVTTLNYDSSFRLTSIVDPMGRSTTFTYGLSSYPLLITEVTDAFSRTTQMTYDTSQRLSTLTDPVGITSSYTYSTSEPTFVSQLTTPYGTSTYSDAINPNDPPVTGYGTRSLTMTDPLGYTDYTYFYQNTSLVPASDPSGTIPTGVSVTNNYLNWRNTYHWNPHEWAVCVTAGGCSISSGVVQSEDVSKSDILHWIHAAYYVYAYDSLESMKKPLENRIWFNYSGQPNPTTSGTYDRTIGQGRVLDDSSSQVASATWATYALPATVTDAVGRVTKYTYATNFFDLLTVQQKTSGTGYSTIATLGSYSNHLPQTYTGADGQAWHYTWNSVGQLSTVKDPNSNTTTYNYDSTGRLSTIVNANSQTVLTNTYDSADRIQTQTDSQGYTLTYAYDNLDRVTSITYPDGTTDQYDYTFQSGPNAGTQSLELRKYTDRLGRVTTYQYDADRRLTSVTEPITGTTTRTTSYDYYEDGTLKDIIDANGNDTRWAIDLESRPTSKTYAYGTSSAQTETYAYENTTSRLHSITDALGQVKTFTYAHDNRITGITYTSTVNPTPNVTFTWDTYFPRLTSMTDGLGTTNYSYTAIGSNGALKLSGTTGPFGTNGDLSLTYDAIGRLSGRTIAGGNETFGYDAINRLNSHVTPLGSFTIGYLGQTNQVTSQSVTNGSTTVSTNWGYDTNTNDRRLISITNSGVSRSYTLGYTSGSVTNPYDIQSITDTAASGHPWATQSHTYTNDMIDRLLTETVTTPGNSTFAYDSLDNPTTVTNPSGTTNPTFNGLNQISTWGSNSYSYDANGNTLSGDGTHTYKWDAENRLIEIDYVGSTAKSQFSYDGLGHRMVDVETASGGGTTTTRYLWCGAYTCQTRDGSDNVVRRDLGEGEYNVSTSQKLVYIPDQLSSVRDVLDASTGNLVQSYDYTPYGAMARSNGSTPTDYQFAELFNHSASGLNFSTTRPQDGITGRWTSRDLIRETAGPNLYEYVRANPLKFTDALGLQFIMPVPIGGGGTYMPPPYPTPPVQYVPPWFPYSPPINENGPGKVYGIGICEGGCVGFSLNDAGGFYFNRGGGIGGPGISEEHASNMHAYCEGRTWKGGYGGTIGGNENSTAYGWQFPFGGVQITYGVPIGPANPVPPNPPGPIWFPR